MPGCCGKSRSTPFCPECGKRVASRLGIEGLLDHCRVTAKSLQGCYESAMNDARMQKDRAAHFKSRAASKLKAYEKWKAWGDALAELIDSRE